jgi:hypothetical protein
MKQVFIGAIGGFVITSACVSILVSKQIKRNEIIDRINEIDERVRTIEKVNKKDK